MVGMVLTKGGSPEEHGSFLSSTAIVYRRRADARYV